MRQAFNAGSNRARGVALLEVLLSSFIMATGMLAMLSMQTLALGTAQRNADLLQAEWLLNDMLERMKANPGGFVLALQAVPEGRVTALCETLSACSPYELAAHDLASWHYRLETLLPAGHGEISVMQIPGYPPASRVYRVRVRWQGQHGGGARQIPASSGIVVL